jgi:hypothetical protein
MTTQSIHNFYKLNDAINSAMDTKTVFILANERTTKEKRISRYYTVFPSFKDFLIRRNKYKHCHEILADHVNNKPNLGGRLVFDFDIKEYEIPDGFKHQIEDSIIEVIDLYFHDIDTNKFIFVWSTSANPTKFSKHLTVKNLYFDQWIEMSKIFYKLFCIVWDSSGHDWIPSSKLIDFQIVRNKASLRMVGSSKLGGYPLTFDDESHTLTDSLIRIYFRNQRLKEQLITKDNINDLVFTEILFVSNTNDDESSEQEEHVNYFSNKNENPVYDENIYQIAFKMYNDIIPNIFKPGKINGKMISLLRIKASRCILSSRIHEQENAFLVINKTDAFYSVKFGCNRFCHYKKVMFIGTIDLHDNEIDYHDNFKDLKGVYEKKQKKKQKEKPKKKKGIVIV